MPSRSSAAFSRPRPMWAKYNDEKGSDTSKTRRASGAAGSCERIFSSPGRYDTAFDARRHHEGVGHRQNRVIVESPKVGWGCVDEGSPKKFPPARKLPPTGKSATNSLVCEFRRLAGYPPCLGLMIPSTSRSLYAFCTSFAAESNVPPFNFLKKSTTSVSLATS